MLIMTKMTHLSKFVFVLTIVTLATLVSSCKDIADIKVVIYPLLAERIENGESFGNPDVIHFLTEYPTKGIGMELNNKELTASIFYWENVEDGDDIEREMIALTHDGYILIGGCRIPVDVIVEQFREKYCMEEKE